MSMWDGKNENNGFSDLFHMSAMLGTYHLIFSFLSRFYDIFSYFECIIREA